MLKIGQKVRVKKDIDINTRSDNVLKLLRKISLKYGRVVGVHPHIPEAYRISFEGEDKTSDVYLFESWLDKTYETKQEEVLRGVMGNYDF